MFVKDVMTMNVVNIPSETMRPRRGAERDYHSLILKMIP